MPRDREVMHVTGQNPNLQLDSAWEFLSSPVPHRHLAFSSSQTQRLTTIQISFQSMLKFILSTLSAPYISPSLINLPSLLSQNPIFALLQYLYPNAKEH